MNKTFKISVIFIIVIFAVKISNAQYIPLYPKLRKWDSIPELSNILKIYNNKQKEKAFAMLDSLANVYYRKNDFTKFLFLKNEEGNLIFLSRQLGRAIDTLVNANKTFVLIGDTISLEYAMNLRFISAVDKRLRDNKFDYVDLTNRQIDIFKKLKYRNKPYADCLANIGLYYNYRGEVIKAVPYLVKANEIGEEIHSLPTIAVTDMTLVNNLSIGQPNAQIRNYKLVYQLLYPNRNVYSLAVYMMYASHFLGNMYFEIGDYKNSLNFDKKALEILDSLKYPASKPPVIFPMNIAKVYGKLGNPEKTKEYLKIGYERFKSQKRKAVGSGEFYFLKAETYYNFNKDSSLFMVNMGLRDTIIDEYHLLNMKFKAQLLAEKKDYDNSLKYQIKALKLLGDDSEKSDAVIPTIHYNSDIDFQRQVYSSIMETYYEKYNLNHKVDDIINSIDAAKMADTCFQEIFSQSTDLDSEDPFIKEYIDFSNQYLTILNDYNKKTGESVVDLVAPIIFNSKSIITNSELYKIREGKQLLNNKELWEKRKHNQEIIRKYENLLRANDTIKDSLLYLNKIKKAEISNLVILFKIRNKQKKLTESSYKNILIDSLQKILSVDEALIDYTMSDSVLYGVCITKSKVKFFVKKHKEITKLIKRYIYDIKTQYADKKTNDDIYNLFLKPVSSLIKNKKHLVIIPDKQMNYIPFENISIDNSTKLIEKYSVSYQYSTSVWAYNKRNSDAPFNPKPLGVAPVFDKKSDIETIFRSAKGMGILSSEMRSKLVSLPYTSKEITSMKTIFSKNNIETNLLLKKDATEKNFKLLTPKYNIIHIATHGYTSKDEYENNGLFFHYDSLDNAKQIDNDGFLYLGEILNLKLDAKLVVLSACNSGNGILEKGEGVMSIAKGFVYAGVPNVINALWRLNDKKTNKLMKLFYTYFSNGDNIAKALQKAKIDMIKQNESPLDWAGIILVGN